MFFNDFIYLFNLFYFCWAFIAAQAFLQLQWAGLPSSCRMWASRCGGLSCSIGCCLGRAGFRSCGFRALEHRLSSCGSRASLLLGRWDLPGSGIELVSPALAGGSFTTEPPGKRPPPPLTALLYLWALAKSLTNVIGCVIVFQKPLYCVKIGQEFTYSSHSVSS